MIIDLRQFDDFPAHVIVETKPGEIQPFDDLIVSIGRVKLDCSFQKSGSEYFCQGTVSAEVEVQCSRCAGQFVLELSNPTDFIIRTDWVPDEEDADAIDDEDYVYTQGKDLVVDIKDIVQQALVLAMPMKPLCQDDCKGLCPLCRVNLNKTACKCVREQVDTRWDKLRGLSGSN
jgi:uncharacterized protein